MPVTEDLEEFLVFVDVDLCYTPVVNDKDLGSGDLLKKTGEAPVSLSQSETSEEFRHIEVECPCPGILSIFVDR